MLEPRKGYDYINHKGTHVIVPSGWRWKTTNGAPPKKKRSIRRCGDCGAEIEVMRNRRGGWAQFEKGLGKYNVQHACFTRDKDIKKLKGNAIRDLFDTDDEEGGKYGS